MPRLDYFYHHRHYRNRGPVFLQVDRGGPITKPFLSHRIGPFSDTIMDSSSPPGFKGSRSASASDHSRIRMVLWIVIAIVLCVIACSLLVLGTVLLWDTIAHTTVTSTYTEPSESTKRRIYQSNEQPVAVQITTTQSPIRLQMETSAPEFDRQHVKENVRFRIQEKLRAQQTDMVNVANITSNLYTDTDKQRLETLQTVGTVPANGIHSVGQELGVLTYDASKKNYKVLSEECFSIDNSTGAREASHNILESLNFNGDPCDDFYDYACSIWPLKHPLPPSQSTYTIYSSVRQRVSSEIELAIKHINETSADSLEIQLKDFYTKCMDVKKMDAEGGQPFIELLNRADQQQHPYPIGKWPIIDPKIDPDTVNPAELVGRLKREYGVDTVIFTYTDAYELNSSRAVISLDGIMLPLGLGIFKQEYYLNDTLYGDVMEAYATLIHTVAQTMANESTGIEVNWSEAKDILDFERQLAAMIDWSANHEYSMQLWTVAELKQQMPTFDWQTFFNELLPLKILPKIDLDKFEVELATPEFMRKLISLLHSTPKRTIQNYCVWRLAKYSLFTLGKQYRQALDDFNTVFRGSTQATPRNEICVPLVRGRFDLPSLDMVTTRVFVRHYFPEQAKMDATRMVQTIRQAFESMITHLTWMDDETKLAALHKAHKMTANAAYPDWVFNETKMTDYYHDFPNASAASSMCLLNILERSWAVNKNMMTVMTPYDHHSFGGPPTATDAWYSAPKNSLSIPSGELQAPFYQLNYPSPINYGAVGAVIGHEMSHGFDQRGAAFDADGNMHNWWTPTSQKQFVERMKCIIDQFNQFCIPPFGCVNGQTTASENMADLAGLKASYRAYKTQTATNSAPARLPYLESFTTDQLFYLSFASFWCGSATDQAIENQLLTDFHSPDRFRVIGTLQNMPEFSQAFNCPVGSKMNPIKKCDIW